MDGWRDEGGAMALPCALHIWVQSVGHQWWLLQVDEMVVVGLRRP